MKFLRLKNKSKLLVGTLIFLFLITMNSAVLEANEMCEEAFEKCIVDAVVTLFIGGAPAFAYYAVGCFVGYSWCLRYYAEI